VENDCRLFEGLFHSKEEWHFPFWKIFFHFRDTFRFLYRANDESDDVTDGST